MPSYFQQFTPPSTDLADDPALECKVAEAIEKLLALTTGYLAQVGSEDTWRYVRRQAPYHVACDELSDAIERHTAAREAVEAALEQFPAIHALNAREFIDHVETLEAQARDVRTGLLPVVDMRERGATEPTALGHLTIPEQFKAWAPVMEAAQALVTGCTHLVLAEHREQDRRLLIGAARSSRIDSTERCIASLHAAIHAGTIQADDDLAAIASLPTDGSGRSKFRWHGGGRIVSRQPGTIPWGDWFVYPVTLDKIRRHQPAEIPEWLMFAHEPEVDHFESVRIVEHFHTRRQRMTWIVAPSARAVKTIWAHCTGVARQSGGRWNRPYTSPAGDSTPGGWLFDTLDDAQAFVAYLQENEYVFTD